MGKKDVIIGVPNNINHFDVMQRVFERTDPPITPQIEIINVEYGTGKILVVNILPGNPPYTESNGNAKIRIGKSSVPFTGSLRSNILTESGESDFTAELIDEDYIKDPIVTVQMLNFKVSVMGEVNRPGTFDITGDRITLLEALSRAGDLSIYGNRTRVAVIREENGKRQIIFHDLRSSDIFDSPCYYLQQNDIVYVEPNKARTGQSRVNSNNSAGVWLSAVSVLATVASLMVTIFR